MKVFGSISLMFLLALAGCAPAGEEEKAVEPAEEETVTEEEVAEAFGEAYETLKGYSYDQKEELQEWARTRLEELNHQMKTLEAKMDDVSDEAKESYSETMADLAKEREAVEARLGELQESSADAWNDVKSGFFAALEELEQGLDDAAKELGEGEA